MSRPARPAPPPPPSRPGQVKVVRSLYYYEAQQKDELSFEEGDTLFILDSSDATGWWKAKCGEETGLVPSNYIDQNTESIDNPVHEAAKRGNLQFLQECLNAGVSANGLDKAGSTALHWAAQGGHIDCARALLSTPGIQLNVQNKMGDTPLHAAAWKGHPEVVEALIRKGAVANLQNKDKCTPLDLSKNTDCSAMLHRATRISGSADNDYLDDEDSD